MGILTDFVIKNEKTKKYLAWGKDIVIMGIFIYMALSHQKTWYAGYDYCAEQACIVCYDEGNFTQWDPFDSNVGGWGPMFNTSGNTTVSIPRMT